MAVSHPGTPLLARSSQLTSVVFHLPGVHELSRQSAIAVAPAKPAEDAVAIPLSRIRFWLVFICLCVCVFLFALDQLILATAIPKITDEFGALDQLPWLANG